MREPTPQELMAFHDGELDVAQAAEVASWVRHSSSARASLAGLAQLGELVRSAADARAGQAADCLADAVMAEIEQSEQPRASVHRLPSAGRARKILRLAPWLGALSAAAAGVLLVLSARPPALEPSVIRDVAPPREASYTAASGPRTAAIAEPEVAAGAAIEAIDLGAHVGSIFMVSEGADVTPVVWLFDDDGAQGRMEPL
jgi:anti-sigma factor RsiW